MVINLEMTFLRCLFYNSLILFVSAAIAKYKQIARLILLSLVISIANIAMLYISNQYVFNMARVAIFCLFPAAALGKTSLVKIMTILSSAMIFCGSALIISHIIENIYIHFVVSSIFALAACGMLPLVNKRIHARRMTVKISRIGKHSISAFIDTGISCGGELVVVLERTTAGNLLYEDELRAAILPDNKVIVDTVGSLNTGLSYVDISDLCVYISKKIKILPARIMLTDSVLPYEALISATNELEASA